jgi:hypothetical protein
MCDKKCGKHHPFTHMESLLDHETPDSKNKIPNLHPKAVAWAISFGFGKPQARLKPWSGHHFAWLGLAHGLRPGHAHHYL